MTRLYVVVEGQTEERFVKDVLAPHLMAHGVYAFGTIVGTPKRRGGAPLIKGGGDWKRWERDIRRVMGEQQGPDAKVTTLFDFYGLPRGFPGLTENRSVTDTSTRCDSLQAALAEQFESYHFIPYVQRHEFEALVLAALPSLRSLLDAEDDIEGLDQLERELGRQPPEDINDGSTTAPSKRLLKNVPSYQKTLHGPSAVELAGLSAIRERCLRLDAWLSQLEGLAQ